ncbi:MAG: hypothetical protein OEX02_19435, partial [Cyclobacteriaceae bacterium]|nr:hypothetical protein [Cyclobacteriaceae bacterium]
MKILYFHVIMILFFSGCVKDEKHSDLNVKGNQIVIGEIDKIYSEILGENRKVWVRVPKTHLFDNYIAIDPSMWWDNREFLDAADSLLSVKSFENKSLFVGIANTMSNGMDMEGVRSDTTISTRHIRSILQLVESVGNKENG